MGLDMGMVYRSCTVQVGGPSIGLLLLIRGYSWRCTGIMFHPADIERSRNSGTEWLHLSAVLSIKYLPGP